MAMRCQAYASTFGSLRLSGLLVGTHGRATDSGIHICSKLSALRRDAWVGKRTAGITGEHYGGNLPRHLSTYSRQYASGSTRATDEPKQLERRHSRRHYSAGWRDSAWRGDPDWRHAPLQIPPTRARGVYFSIKVNPRRPCSHFGCLARCVSSPDGRWHSTRYEPRQHSAE
jgi:hypothetical protein